MRTFLSKTLVAALLLAPFVSGQPARAEFGHYAFDFNVYTWKITRPEVAGDETRPATLDANGGTKDDPYFRGRVDYLVGTMHFPVKPDEEDIPGPLKRLLEKSTAFAMEADLTKFNRKDVKKFVNLAPGQNLQRALSPRAWETLSKNYAAKNISPATLAHSKPWMLELMSSSSSKMAGGLDTYLLKVAGRSSKHLYYLETMEDQIRAIDAGTFDERVEMLERTINDPDGQFESVRAQMDSYKFGFLDASRGLVFDEELMRHYPVFYKELFDNRNEAWMPKMVDLMAKEDVVVAVGLGHLVCPGGLLQMLKEKGYAVEPVTFQ